MATIGGPDFGTLGRGVHSYLLCQQPGKHHPRPDAHERLFGTKPGLISAPDRRTDFIPSLSRRGFVVALGLARAHGSHCDRRLWPQIWPERSSDAPFRCAYWRRAPSIFVSVSSLSAETAMPIRRVGSVPKARWKSVVQVDPLACLSGAGRSQNQCFCRAHLNRGSAIFLRACDRHPKHTSTRARRSLPSNAVSLACGFGREVLRHEHESKRIQLRSSPPLTVRSVGGTDAR